MSTVQKVVIIKVQTDKTTQPSTRKVPMARKSTSGGQSRPPAKVRFIDPIKKQRTTNRISEKRELDRLKFVNPGKQMANLEVNWSEPNLTRSTRKRLTAKSTRGTSKHTRYLYDSRGRLMETLEDICDCIRPDCPGCHLSCRKCRSMCCGATCRIYRTFRVSEVKLFI